MERLDTPEKKEIYIRNKGRIERAVWFDIQLKPSYITSHAISIDTRGGNYSSEFIDKLPSRGSECYIVNVRAWKKYPGKIRETQYWIEGSGLQELYRDNENILIEGKVIGIANSPENINELWIDPEHGHGNWLDKDQGKIIILSMIAIRPFSEKFSLDLQNKKVREEFKKIVIESYNLLKELNLIKLDKDDIYGKDDWIDPLVNLFLINSRQLQQRTKEIFRISGNVKYFLDASRGSEIIKDNVISLIKIIVGKEYSNLNRISDFCINISRDKSGDFFDIYEHIFSKPRYDNIMKDIIMKDIKLSDIHI